MIKIYKTEGSVLLELHEPEEGCWINLTAPAPEECKEIAMRYHIYPEDLAAALDEEESSRVFIEDDYTEVLVDIPSGENDDPQESYFTIPLGMIFNDEVIITICSRDTRILSHFEGNNIRDFSTRKRLRFIFQILEQTAALYQADLRRINHIRADIEQRASSQSDSKDLIALHQLETSLVYFATSLRANEGVLDRLMRYVRIKKYPEDQELLDDVIIENKQAIEMTTIYKDIVNGTRELLASMADSKLNNVMKYLTSITLVLAIPTIISGFYGMNVDTFSMPFAHSAHSFLIICVLTTLICIVVLYTLKKRKML